ncbi:hypothetical protein KFL_004790055 [Klebsormidium nitens]|uniref:Exostosin GT47 domain-containing protein n=1 Tax=Klebsormidium nitens TaxID=105231 RepID=A0A1Y1IG28_KLENI|nr:hypothetical protein KFL_004790055 [Klebsormidium nitens]|eukprot:GAQ89012.1 hypothetical protein KFL_004790055 [Klebsormidium nitens]
MAQLFQWRLRYCQLRALHPVGRFYAIALALSIPLAFMLFAAHRDLVTRAQEGGASWLTSAEPRLTSARRYGTRIGGVGQELGGEMLEGREVIEYKYTFERSTTVRPAGIGWPFGRAGIAGIVSKLLQMTSPAKSAKNSIDSAEQLGGPLRVYMYDLPAQFNWGIIDKSWEHSRFSNTTNGVNIGGISYPLYPGSVSRKQHSIAFWLTLDLLSAAHHNATRANWERAAVRVADPKDADVFFVPFFSSLSYNGNSHRSIMEQRSVQLAFVDWLTQQPPWKASGGSDHVIPVHHPNALNLCAHMLRSARFIVADFGRQPRKVSNEAKDIVAPYKHMVPTYVEDSAGWEARKSLLFFQGQLQRKAGGAVRQELLGVLGRETGVVMQPGRPSSVGVADAATRMRDSRFCLMPAGDTPSSCRLFDAIASHCVPVVVSDQLELPFEDVLDYTRFAIFVPAERAVQPGYLVGTLRNVTQTEWEAMWQRLKEVDKYFEYGYPPQRFGSEQMIWQAIGRKVRGVNRGHNRRRRREVLGLPP